MNTARIVSANLKSVSFRECYNDYLAEIPEDDQDFLDEVKARIKQGIN